MKRIAKLSLKTLVCLYIIGVIVISIGVCFAVRDTRHTVWFLAGILFTSLLSYVLYWHNIRVITKEITILQNGLDRVIENNLDYRIDHAFRLEEYSNIASSINRIMQLTQDNVDRMNEYQLRQREAEIQQLQAKFNPHFLYNSLEMFRARCFENGDEDTADLIAQTASIFRGFINTRTIVSIREELAFTKRYLSLYRARYGDRVEIRYDFDTDVLDCGIIRNTLQPMVENYFEHGFDADKTNNRIAIEGHKRDAESIVIRVCDNGVGMPPKDINALNQRLTLPVSSETESYGLKNLYQRLRLFYGENYGLTVYPNAPTGLIFELIVGIVSPEPKPEL